uniref:Uncharacterized protein n=1 Tax=Chenopodium quinoa TaxID=63459 RepID=A0A803MB21_CHEQI
MGKETEMRRLVVESDCLSVIEALRNKSETQRLLKRLTQELQTSGVDLSQANISVQLDVGKGGNSGSNAIAPTIEVGMIRGLGYDNFIKLHYCDPSKEIGINEGVRFLGYGGNTFDTFLNFFVEYIVHLFIEHESIDDDTNCVEVIDHYVNKETLCDFVSTENDPLIDELCDDINEVEHYDEQRDVVGFGKGQPKLGESSVRIDSCVKYCNYCFVKIG